METGLDAFAAWELLDGVLDFASCSNILEWALGFGGQAGGWNQQICGWICCSRQRQW